MQLSTTLGKRIGDVSKVMGSRSRNDVHRNVVSLIARVLLKEFELTVFSVMDQRSRLTLPKF